MTPVKHIFNKISFGVPIFCLMMGLALLASIDVRAEEHEGIEWDPEVRAQYDSLIDKRLELSALLGDVVKELRINDRHKEGLRRALAEFASLSEEIGQIAGVTVMGNMIEEDFECTERTNDTVEFDDTDKFRPAVWGM